MRSVAIVGGGISGLAAAFSLEQARRAGALLRYQLLEASSRLGGILKSELREGFLLEHGAEAFLTEKSAARELARELGIESQIVGSNDDIRKTYVLAHGRLVPLPEGLVFVAPGTAATARWELFSAATREQFAREREMQPGASSEDESVATFVERHFGGEAVQWLAGPMLAGVYGGSAQRLSARAVLPRLVEVERAYGSLITTFERRSARVAAPVFSAFKLGMQQLADTLTAQLDKQSVTLSAPATGLARNAAAWTVTTGGRSEDYDAVIMAAPTHVAAELLAPVAADLARELAAVEHSSCVTVSLGVQSAQPIPAGFGFLVPRCEGKRLMACTFSHQKFASRAPQGGALLRAFFGGTEDAAALELSDAELIQLARCELSDILHFDVRPAVCAVQRWPRSMPQYNVGHLERIRRIEQFTEQLPGMFLAGSAYGGVGIPDCIRTALKAARAALESGRKD